MILGQYQRCWGSRSKLSHEDVMWPEFSPPPLHNSVLLPSISSFHQSNLLYFGIPMQRIRKPSGMQMNHLGVHFLPLGLSVPPLSPRQQHTFHSTRLPCFLAHCLTLNAQVSAHGRDVTHCLAPSAAWGYSASCSLPCKSGCNGRPLHWRFKCLGSDPGSKTNKWMILGPSVGRFHPLYLVISSSN